MSFFDFLQGAFTGNVSGVHPTRIVVRADRYVSTGGSPATIPMGVKAAAEKHYVRVWVTRMLLEKSKDWFTTVHPAVYSAIQLAFGDNPSVELSNLAGPKQLGDLKPVSTNKSLMVNLPMTGLLPFRGGAMKLSCGLASIPIQNLLVNFLDTMGDFASKLAQPQVSTALGLASSIASGIQSLMGASKAQLVLYYSDTYTGLPGQQSLESGFIFLCDKPTGSISADQLWLIDGEPRLGSSATSAKAITGMNYMLLQIELATERDDVAQIKSISDPLFKAQQAKLNGNPEEVEQHVVAAKIAALLCPDLTGADRKRIGHAIDAEYSAQKAHLAQSIASTEDTVLTDLLSAHKMDLDDALKESNANFESFVLTQ